MIRNRRLVILLILMSLTCASAVQASAIRYAIVHGDAARVHKILDADPKATREMNKYDFLHQTPLHLAIRHGRTDIARLLIEHGANVNAKDRDGNTPLHLCGFYKQLSELLITKGARINAQDKQGKTPLHYLVSDQRKSVEKSLGKLLETAKLLIAKHANLNAKDSCGCTPLHLAARTGHTEIARLLICKGSNVNARNKIAETPLHEASSHGHKELVKLLIAAGADINARSDDRNACVQIPLQRPIGTGRTLSKTSTRKTPLGVARNQEIADIIRAHGGIE